MTHEVLLPRLGNTVESSIIVAWLKQPGEAVAEGDALCTVETDKATMDVPSTVSGVLLRHLVNVGDDVPVLTPIATVVATSAAPAVVATSVATTGERLKSLLQSPRARRLAQESGLDPANIAGSGPGGRIIERDVRAAVAAALAAAPQAEPARITPVAKAMLEGGGYVAPERGSGPGGRITKEDLMPAAVEARHSEPRHGAALQDVGDYDVIPLPNIRRVIAERMRGSLQTTAQLTMTALADARAMLAYRQRLKGSDEALGLRGATINDLVLLAVAKTLPQFPQLNATYADGELRQHRPVHLGFAVDTPRGLLVPVIRGAHALTLRQLAAESSRLVHACQAGSIAPDALAGGTFTVTNLGQFGIESFTPILNVPQVAILGVGAIGLRAIEIDGVVQHVPHLGLSLTIDHQIVDGVPGAKFLQALCRALAQFDLVLAL